MKRALSVLALVALLMPLGVSETFARASAVTFRLGSWFFDNPIEQQTPCSPDGTGCGATQPDRSLWVNNVPDPYADVPTYQCPWDPDDEATAFFAGDTLAAGASVTGSLCEVVDDNPHEVLLGPLPAGIAGSVSVGGYLSLDVGPGRTGCIDGPQFDHPTSFNPSVYADPRLQPIASSNGGAGEFDRVTFTLRNVSGKTLRKVPSVWARVLKAIDEPTVRCPWPISTNANLRTPYGTYPMLWSEAQ